VKDGWKNKADLYTNELKSQFLTAQDIRIFEAQPFEFICVCSLRKAKE